MGSLDQPGGLAGGSYQHMYGDEARLLKHAKLKKLTPAIRGEYAMFGGSVYLEGLRLDMPNVIDGDDDWILQDEKNMDLNQVKLALEAGLVLNEIKREILRHTSKSATMTRLKSCELDSMDGTLGACAQELNVLLCGFVIG